MHCKPFDGDCDCSRLLTRHPGLQQLSNCCVQALTGDAMGDDIAAATSAGAAAETVGLALQSACEAAHLMMSSDSYIETPVLSSTCGPHAPHGWHFVIYSCIHACGSGACAGSKRHSGRQCDPLHSDRTTLGRVPAPCMGTWRDLRAPWLWPASLGPARGSGRTARPSRES